MVEWTKVPGREQRLTTSHCNFILTCPCQCSHLSSGETVRDSQQSVAMLQATGPSGHAYIGSLRSEAHHYDQEHVEWSSPVKHIQVNLDMTDHCTTDFCIWRTICLVPVLCISSICHMYTTDFAYDGPIFLVPLSPSYPSLPVYSTYDWTECQPPMGRVQAELKLSLTLMLLVANLANTKWCKKTWKWTKPWQMGTHLRVLSESFQMNTNKTGFRWFSKNFASLCFEWK